MNPAWQLLMQVPWPELTRLLVTALLCLLTWLLSKHWYAKEWRRFAPEKARDELKAAALEVAREKRRAERALAMVARLRGQVAAARARLETPIQLELVERAEARR